MCVRAGLVAQPRLLFWAGASRCHTHTHTHTSKRRGLKIWKQHGRRASPLQLWNELGLMKHWDYCCPRVAGFTSAVGMPMTYHRQHTPSRTQDRPHHQARRGTEKRDGLSVVCLREASCFRVARPLITDTQGKPAAGSGQSLISRKRCRKETLWWRYVPSLLQRERECCQS